jgi:hypothetical protein
MTVTCARTRERLAAAKKRVLTIEKAMIATTSTASGPSTGLPCSRC